MRKNWVKLNLFYIGQSAKKHQIFRAKQWNSKLEKIFKQPVFNEKYQKVGYIKDIIGPVDSPFLSVKIIPNTQFNPDDKLFTKIT